MAQFIEIDVESINVLVCCPSERHEDAMPLFTVPVSLLKKAIDDDFGGRSSMSLPTLPKKWRKEPKSFASASNYHLFVLVPNRRAVVDQLTDYDLFLSVGKNGPITNRGKI